MQLEQGWKRPYGMAKTVYEREIASAYLDEEFTTSMLYCNADIFNCLGQDACIVLDVALACSGCEAIVEGFYSVIKAHAKSGGQSNKVLVERAVVDWALPHPLACPSTIAKIGKLFKKLINNS